MSAVNKKRKLLNSFPAGVSKTMAAKETSASERFAMDSDFSDLDDGQLGVGVGPGPGTKAGSSGRRAGAAVPPTKAAAAAGASAATAGRRRPGVAARRAEPDCGGAHGEQAQGGDDGNDNDDGGAEPLSGSAGDEEGVEEGGAGRSAARGSDDDAEAGGSGDDDGEVGDGDGGGKAGVSGEADGEGAVEARRIRKVLSKRKLERNKEESDRRGIVYISRIPPHMKPHKLRQLLAPYGDLGRVYCAPEDPTLRRMRKQKGGNSGKNFTEGWIEFEDKRRAKRAATMLNGQPMGGSKRSAYYYDLWTLKYLPKFKWDTLTEEINYQRAVREQRLVAEISAAKRERDFYLSRVDKAKAIDAITERRAKKALQAGTADGAQAGPASAGAAQVGAAAAPAAAGAAGDGGKSWGPRFERHFGQRRAKADPVSDERAPVLAQDVLGLFGRKQQKAQ